MKPRQQPAASLLYLWGLAATGAALPAAAPDGRLRENQQLLEDPALVDPVVVPWALIGLGVAVLFVVALLVWWRRRQRAAVAAPVPIEPPEDVLAALDAAWARANPGNLEATITELAAALRRHLGRRLAANCTSRTTDELHQLFSAAGQPLLTGVRTDFFVPADFMRFAGQPGTLADVRQLYDVARRFVAAGQAGAATSPSGLPDQREPAAAGRSPLATDSRPS